MNMRRTARQSLAVLASGLVMLWVGGCAAEAEYKLEPVLNQAAEMSDSEMAIARATCRLLDAEMEIECHNLANINAPGYKALQPVRESLPLRVGESGGARLSLTVMDMTQGSPMSGGGYDLFINGHGFIQVELEGDRGVGYTRGGRLTLNPNRELVTLVGARRVIPRIVVPADSSDITISEDGAVWILPSDTDAPQEIGRIELAMFMVPQALAQTEGTLYAQTLESGYPIVGQPGIRNCGKVQQGYYECSNVDPSDVAVNIERIRRCRALWGGSTAELRSLRTAVSEDSPRSSVQNP